MKDTTPAELWTRLEQFDLNEMDSELRFSDRLAAENAWRKIFALRVVEEYKRFVFLSQVAGHPVTPSDEIDQAWHLHLCYTRSYWEEMCGAILIKPLHHGPTRGGKSEHEKFVDWYAKTLESYREHFGTEPPSDIWPASRERFSKRQFQRVDTSKNFVLKRSSLVASAAALGSVMLFAGCVEYFTDDHGDLDAQAIFTTVFLASIVLAFLYSLFKGGNGKGGGCGGGGCGGGGGGWFGGGSDGCSSGCGGGGCGGG